MKPPTEASPTGTSSLTGKNKTPPSNDSSPESKSDKNASKKIKTTNGSDLIKDKE
jgi:hypothetical protein